MKKTETLAEVADAVHKVGKVENLVLKSKQYFDNFYGSCSTLFTLFY